MASRRFTIFALLLLAAAYRTAAQEPVVREQTGGQPVLYERHVLRTDSGTTVLIPYRIRHDFFVFVRPMTDPAGPFTAAGEVSVELIDSTGGSVARTIQQIQLSAADNAPSVLRALSHQDFLSFSVTPGTYTIVFTAEDKESKRRFAERQRTVTVAPLSAKAPLGTLIPVQSADSSSFTLFNLGGDVHFSRDYTFLFPLNAPATTVKATLKRVMQDDEEQHVLFADSTISVRTITATTATIERTTAGIVLSLPGNGSRTFGIAPFNGARLRQGRYRLTLTLPDSTSFETSFGARWTEMPRSLNDLDLATEPLQFIMTKSEYSALRRGGRESRIRKFEEFWEKKDPTPATAYNEMMHEFYRRVDAAVTAFRTLKQENGSVTDRGRIYIQYGPPTSTERLLAPDGAPKEIWTYRSLNKVFTFEDPTKQGNYKLTERQ